MIGSDRLLGAVGLTLGVAFIWGATLIETGFIVDPLGPRSFPIIIGSVLLLGSLYVLVRPDPEPAWPAMGRVFEILGALAVLIGYTYALEPLGFVVSTAVAAAILSWRLGSKPLWGAVSGLGISLGIYVIFHIILGLSLARGPWGF
ncbi:MAG: tripartite tricarboxylate transporter TctB family protein [Kiloniellaceae bacterium]